MAIHEENRNHIASGLASLNASVDLVGSGTYQAGAGITAVAASLSTALAGTNDDLTFTAVTPGTAGNGITVRYVDPAGNNQSLNVTVSTLAITVNLATGAGGAITSTAADIATAIAASGPAAALVTAANKTGNDGTGVVIAMAATNLAGGLDTTGDTAALTAFKQLNNAAAMNVHEESRYHFASQNRYVEQNLLPMEIYTASDIIASETTALIEAQFVEDNLTLPAGYHSARGRG